MVEESTMSEKAETPTQDGTPENTTGRSKWVRIQSPIDIVTIQDVLDDMQKAQQQWVERTVRKGRTPPPPSEQN